MVESEVGLPDWEDPAVADGATLVGGAGLVGVPGAGDTDDNHPRTRPATKVATGISQPADQSK